MKSQTILKDKKKSVQAGFTFIEILVVMAMITIIASLALFFDFDSFHGHSFHSERDTLISALQYARGEAVSNICRGNCTDGKPQGVYIANDKFVIFQGTSYDSSSPYNTIMDANPGIAHGGLKEIVFAQLSGDVGTPGDITLTDNTNSRTSTISINSEGQILWTN